MVGPYCQLMFWVPPASQHLLYSPRIALVITRGGPELDSAAWRMDNTTKRGLFKAFPLAILADLDMMIVLK
jgi:hypothetical protein